MTEEPRSGRRIQSSELCKRVFKYDRYTEELGTLFLLQYVASNREEATAWYFFFNEFNISEFSKDDFVDSLQKYIQMSDDGY